MLKRDYSVLITAHSGDRVYSFHVNRWAIRAGLILFIAFALGSTAVIYTAVVDHRVLNDAVVPAYATNIILAEENMRLYEEIETRDDAIGSLEFRVEKEREEYAQALARLHASIKRLNKFYTDLKIMAGFRLSADEAKRLNGGVEDLGSGGPSMDRYEYVQSMLLQQDEDFIRESLNREGVLAKECARCEKEFLILKAMLEKKKSLLADMPDMPPVRGIITSYFGARRANGIHNGLDIAAPLGTPIVAPADAVVIQAGPRSLYGNVVFLDHGEGVTSRYAHLSDVNCSVGDRVVRGDVIGFMGATGWATGSHLHYEIRINGVPVDPINYLNEKLQVHIVDGSKRINVDIPEDFEETLELAEGDVPIGGGSDEE
jgi:murein DD-endopeptidase MepM/ murein hydrolase activator NlpD